jgi:hypothetical protein
VPFDIDSMYIKVSSVLWEIERRDSPGTSATPKGEQPSWQLRVLALLRCIDFPLAANLLFSFVMPPARKL